MECRLSNIGTDTVSPPRGAKRPSRAFIFRPTRTEGAGNAGCALHPRSRVQNAQRKRTRAYRFSGGNPAFPAQWSYGLCRALPGDEFVLVTVIGGLMALPDPVGLAKTSPIWHQQRMPGPHGFAVRFSAVRLRAGRSLTGKARPAIPLRADAAASTASRPTFVTMANAPFRTGPNGNTADLGSPSSNISENPKLRSRRITVWITVH
jgi:hypothetical protein